ncbi:TraR/DksA family transcriptional regulator [Aeromicrobium sp. CTD01-1L150]|uniref:TraR/DksA family transcriptional regulator n=1 Tax=Aeromicrobium sp. CTD01-1L150 TaxID=3341830 RepID=UPI0035C0D7D5
MAGVARLLAEQRAEAVRRLAALERDVDGIVEASRSSNADDEHDPEGATIAFEREQLSALVARARQRLVDLDDAAARVTEGTYGRCGSCGTPIAAARLEALPTTQTCRDCAG